MNDILKEFKIVFGLDNKELESGIKESSSSLKNFGKLFGGIVATYFSVGVFKNVIDGFVNFNNELRYNIDLLGGDSEKITALGGALKRFGGDTNSVINAMNSLSGALGEAENGGGALIEVSKKYGIAFNPFASAESTLESLSKQMGNFSKQQRKAIAEQLGFDRALTIAFVDGGKELGKLIEKQKEYGATTEEDLKISKEFSYSFLDLKDIFSSLMRDFARVVLPSFTKLIELFSNFISFLRKHKTLVVGFFVALLVAMSPILIAFAKMAIASVAAFAPIYAVIAVVSAISLVLEDIYYYFNGWDSVTGKLVNKFPVLAEVLELIKPLVMLIFETFEKVLDFLKNPSWESFKDIFKTLGKYLVDFFNKPLELALKYIGKLQEKFPTLAPLLEPLKMLVEAIKDAFNYLVDLISNFSIDNLVRGFSNLKESISGGISSFIDKINPFTSNSNLEPMAIPNTPQLPQQQTNNSSTYNINNNINQNITSATPKSLADSTNRLMVDSVNAMRQQRGAL